MAGDEFGDEGEVLHALPSHSWNSLLQHAEDALNVCALKKRHGKQTGEKSMSSPIFPL